MPDPKKKALTQAKKDSLTQAKKDYESKGTTKGKDPNRKRPTGAKKRPDNVPGRKPKKPTFGKKAPRGEGNTSAKRKPNKEIKSKQVPNFVDGAVKMKASPEKKAAAKAKAIKGGMPENVANRVFKMSMGSKSAKNSDSAFSMYSEKVMQMSPIFMTDPPVKAKPPRNTLYSYEQTNTNVKRSGGGSESSNVQKKSTSNLADYQKGLKDLGPDFKPTAAQTAAANKKVAELKAKDESAKAFNKNISKSNKSSVEKSVDKKKVVLGDQTQAEILKKGQEFKDNRKSKLAAERGAAMDRAQRDSISAAKSYLKTAGRYNKLTERDMRLAAQEGNKAARKTMNQAYSKKMVLGKEMNDQKLFDAKDAHDAFKLGHTYNRPPASKIVEGYNKMSKRQKKKASEKLGPRKYQGIQNLGTHSAIPKLSDLQMNIGDKALKYYNRKK